MLGLKYVVAKSKELQVKLEQRAGVTSATDTTTSTSSRYSAHTFVSTTTVTTSSSATAPPTQASAHGSAAPPVAPSHTTANAASHHEGEQFLTLQHKQFDAVHAKHEQLLASGEQLSNALAWTRQQLQDQVESEHFIQQHFLELASVREQIAHMRSLVVKIAADAEDVENFLVQKTEEFMAAQNASFAARQQEELELFEARILSENEERTRQLLEARRAQLAQAFANDLKTYQTLVTYQGDRLATTAVAVPNYTPETLESVDLIVTADAAQLDAFYDVSSSSDEEEQEEEEKQESVDRNDGASTADDRDAAAATDATLEEHVTATGTEVLGRKDGRVDDETLDAKCKSDDLVVAVDTALSDDDTMGDVTV